MEDLALPVSHFRRFWGSLWSRGPPAPCLGGLSGGQHQLLAHLGEVLGLLGFLIICSREEREVSGVRVPPLPGVWGPLAAAEPLGGGWSVAWP